MFAVTAEGFEAYRRENFRSSVKDWVGPAYGAAKLISSRRLRRAADGYISAAFGMEDALYQACMAQVLGHGGAKERAKLIAEARRCAQKLVGALQILAKAEVDERPDARDRVILRLTRQIVDPVLKAAVTRENLARAGLGEFKDIAPHLTLQ